MMHSLLSNLLARVAPSTNMFSGSLHAALVEPPTPPSHEEAQRWETFHVETDDLIADTPAAVLALPMRYTSSVNAPMQRARPWEAAPRSSSAERDVPSVHVSVSDASLLGIKNATTPTPRRPTQPLDLLADPLTSDRAATGFLSPKEVFRAAASAGSHIHRQINNNVAAAHTKTWWGTSPLGAIALHDNADDDGDGNDSAADVETPQGTDVVVPSSPHRSHVVPLSGTNIILPTLHYRVGVYVGTNSIVVFDAAGAHVASVPFSSLMTIGWRPHIGDVGDLHDEAHPAAAAMKYRQEFERAEGLHNNGYHRQQHHRGGYNSSGEDDDAINVAPYAELEIVAAKVVSSPVVTTAAASSASLLPFVAVDLAVVIGAVGLDGVRHLSAIKTQLENRWGEYLGSGGAQRSAVLRAVMAAQGDDTKRMVDTRSRRQTSSTALVTTGTPLLTRGAHDHLPLYRPPAEAIVFSAGPTHSAVSRDQFEPAATSPHAHRLSYTANRLNIQGSPPQQQQQHEQQQQQPSSPWRPKDILAEEAALKKATRSHVLNATSLSVTPFSSSLRRDLMTHRMALSRHDAAAAVGFPSTLTTSATGGGLDINISVIGPAETIAAPHDAKDDVNELQKAFDVMMQQQERRKRQQQLRDSTPPRNVDRHQPLGGGISRNTPADQSKVTAAGASPVSSGSIQYRSRQTMSITRTSKSMDDDGHVDTSNHDVPRAHLARFLQSEERSITAAKMETSSMTTGANSFSVASPQPLPPSSTSSSQSRIQYPLTCVSCGNVFDLRNRAEHLKSCVPSTA